MYDCLGEKEMHRPAPEEHEERQRKESDVSDKRDVNVARTCRERSTGTQRRF